jgi:hypothetical protein
VWHLQSEPDMKWISKAELKLLKHISKLEGQLASAHYALDLLRSDNEQILQPRSMRRTTQSSGLGIAQPKNIPLFS